MERKARINFSARRSAPPGADPDASPAYVFSEDLTDLHRLIAVVGDLDLPLAFAGSLEGFSVTAAARRRPAPSARPAIVLCCIDQAGLDDPHFADRLGCLPPSSRFVLLVSGKCAPNGLDRLPSGAVALLPASTSSERLAPALRLVLAGFVIFPEEMMARALPDAASGDDPGAHILTRRQREICQLVASGKSNKQIANQFGISVNTVNAHLQAIRLRLGVQNRTMIAIRTTQPNSGL